MDSLLWLLLKECAETLINDSEYDEDVRERLSVKLSNCEVAIDNGLVYHTDELRNEFATAIAKEIGGIEAQFDLLFGKRLAKVEQLVESHMNKLPNSYIEQDFSTLKEAVEAVCEPRRKMISIAKAPGRGEHEGEEVFRARWLFCNDGDEDTNVLVAFDRWRGASEGARLIAKERRRQLTDEGWSPEHDDGHIHGDLAVHAAQMAVYGTDAEVHDELERPDWGLVEKHKDDRIRMLVISGALLAAEIDRIIRTEGSEPVEVEDGA